MRSKKSKPRQSPPAPWKAESSCSEAGLEAVARALVSELKPGQRVLLDGPMGAGKTTFARMLLKALGVRQPPEGSPTFAIAHEYDCPRGEVVHTDLYRLKSEAELEDAGILAYFWERPQAIVISEWLSNWPEIEGAIQKSGNCWRVKLDFADREERRKLEIISPEA